MSSSTLASASTGDSTTFVPHSHICVASAVSHVLAVPVRVFLSGIFYQGVRKGVVVAVACDSLSEVQAVVYREGKKDTY